MPSSVSAIVPGLLLCGILALSAQEISETHLLKGHFPVGAVMLAIILGTMVRQFAPVSSRMEPGIRFAFRKILRIGVAGLGFGLTFADFREIGVMGVFLDTSLIAGTYLFAIALKKWLQMEENLTWLLATGTAICGASAVVAANTVLKAREEEVAFSVATVTLFGTISMFLYPIIARFAGIPIPIYGAWAGSSIHEVAQVIGSTMNISPQALAFATIVKLTRVAFLLPVLILLELFLLNKGAELIAGKGSSRRNEHFPWFVVGFGAVVVLNSLHLFSPALLNLLQKGDTWLLAVSMAALGLETHLGRMANVGPSAVKAGFWLWIFVSIWGLILSLALFGHSFHPV
ncbi:MAG: YeiH family protein [Leptospirales bacterium]